MLIAAHHHALRVQGGLRALLLAAVALTSAGQAWSQADEARAKKIASGSCFLCHGGQGESTSELFPKLGGQHWEYISKQLANFKSGARKSRDMSDVTARLKPDEMDALGRYFEKMQLPKEPVRDAALVARGQVIYAEGLPAHNVPACASCHGAEGFGAAALPRLAGQVAVYTETQLKRFGARQRTNDNAVMQQVAAAMSAADIAAVAHYLESR